MSNTDVRLIRVQPNWVARISMAAVLLLLLFFVISLYNQARDNRVLLEREASARDSAESDRRLADEALAQSRIALDQARAAQEAAAKDRAKALEQNGQLVEIALSLEDQVVGLGGTPIVKRNGVLRLRALAPRPVSQRGPAGQGTQGGSSAPSYFRRPAAASGGHPAPQATRTTAPRPSTKPTSTPKPSPTTTEPPVLIDAPTIVVPLLPSANPTLCVSGLLCVK